MSLTQIHNSNLSGELSKVHNAIQIDPAAPANSLQINENGVVKVPNRPHLKIGVGANYTGAGIIRFDNFGGGAVFGGEDTAGGMNTSTYKYTIPTGCSGIWHISSSVWSSTPYINQIGIYVNDVREDAIGSDAAVGEFCQGAIMKRLTEGDEIHLQSFHTSGSPTIYANSYHTWWEMTYIG